MADSVNTNKTAKFAQNPRTSIAVVIAALGSINTDTPTGLQLLLTAPAGGGILTRLTAMPRATITPASLVLYLSKDGLTFRPVDSELMAGQSISATSAIAETTFSNYTELSPFRMEDGDRLYVGSQVVPATPGGIVFRAEWSDFVVPTVAP